ncbi:MAG: DUF2190 family protein, partial [Magnetococcales bacterium]|nr:DUF2190 family protein [Magnetococcales bacterium]
MKNWILSGDTVTVVAPAAVNSGEGLMVGSLFGVAVSTAAINENVEISTTGVVDLPKASGAITQGAKIYWDNTAKNITTTVGTNTLIGCAIVAAAVGDATARVRL